MKYMNTCSYSIAIRNTSYIYEQCYIWRSTTLTIKFPSSIPRSAIPLVRLVRQANAGRHADTVSVSLLPCWSRSDLTRACLCSREPASPPQPARLPCHTRVRTEKRPPPASSPAERSGSRVRRSPLRETFTKVAFLRRLSETKSIC